jgi:invasion protein IalB
MSSLRVFLFIVTLASLVGADAAIAQQPGAAPGAAQKAATPAQQLPNGASSINETYGEWAVNCRLVEGQKQCALAHAQGNSQTGQRVFAVELRTPKDGKTEGTILMPFGLKLDTGVLLKLDDKDLGQGLHFSTCVPQGCLVPVSLPTAATDAMKKGKTLTLASLNLNGGDAVAFNVPLEGFAAATARVVELGK